MHEVKSGLEKVMKSFDGSEQKSEQKIVNGTAYNPEGDIEMIDTSSRKVAPTVFRPMTQLMKL
jgi:hypothetical protein